MSRVYRLATQDDLPELEELARLAQQPEAELPDLVFVAQVDDRIVAAVGVELGHPGMVVVSGGIIHPEFYRNPFVVFRLQEFLEDWLIKQGCYAYVFSVSKRNTRMQRWMEKLGSRRYTKKHGAIWYVRTIGPKRQVIRENAA